jgi:serine/threonine protein kinase/tetratricopeptide (TPR) repeat protein
MTPQRWQQIDSLLQTVVDSPPDRRTSLLDEACTGDQALREEVESLLHFREMAQSFLEIPALEEVAGLLVEDRPDLMVGLLVDRYRIEQQLGAGSMGEVYLAEDTWLDRKVAIKFLPSLQADEISRKRLVREAKAAARLDHPNICAVYEVNEADSESFIVMQYVAGKTLGDTIKDQRLSLSDLLNIAIQILEALAEAHSHGIVHRDIKPGNVMITPRGQVKVLDFGLAKYVGSATLQQHSTGWSDHLSRPGERAGTPFYMSPEQARGVTVDARSDLFAVGIILYQCLTGSLPFSGKTVTEILEQVIHVDPLPPSSLNPEVPVKLETVIVKALTKQLDARYQSATELLQDLNELRATLPPGDTTPGPMPAPSYKPLPRSFWNTVSEVSRQPRNLVFAASIPLLVGFVLWWSWPPCQPPAEARRRYEAGTLALRNGAYFQASRELEHAVATDAKFALAHARLAEAYAELDLSDKAKDEIIRAQLIADDQRMEESANLYLQGITSAAVRDFVKATAAYQKLLARVPAEERASVYLDLGRSYEKNDDIEKAKESYQQAANLAPQDAVAYLRLGRLYSRREELDSALESFQKAEAAYRASNNLEGAAEVFFERGFLLLNLVRLSEAENDLEVALRMATEAANVSQQIRALLALSSVAVHEGRTADAEAKAKRAIELAQSNGMEYQATGGLAWLGTTYFIRGDKSKAEECYQRSLDLARRNNGRLNEAIALVHLANLMQSQHRTDQVFAYLDQALPFLQQGGYRKWLSQAMQISGRAYRDRGDYEVALKSFSEWLRLDEEINDFSQVAHSHVEIGNVLIREERYQEALAHFDKAHELFSSLRLQLPVGYVADNRSGALWQLGRYLEARASLDEASSIAETLGNAGVYLRSNIRVNTALMELSAWHLSEARVNSRRALDFSGDQDPDPDTAVQANYSMGLAQVRSGASRDGKRLCEIAVETATRTGDPELISAATLALSEALLETGDSSQALTVALDLKDKLVGLHKQSSEWRAWLIAARASERLGNLAASREYASRAAERLSGIEQGWTTEAYAGYLARPDIQRFRSQLDQLLKL